MRGVGSRYETTVTNLLLQEPDETKTVRMHDTLARMQAFLSDAEERLVKQKTVLRRTKKQLLREKLDAFEDLDYQQSSVMFAARKAAYAAACARRRLSKAVKRLKSPEDKLK